MKHFRTMGFLIALAMLAAPLSASAQEMAVDPLEYDYGDVVIGEQAEMIFSVINTDGAELTIDEIVLENESNPGVFTVISEVPPPPIFVPIGESYEITVVYTPTTESLDSVDLRIRSDALGNPEEIVPIMGLGVLDEPEPGDAMADLIAFFEASVADGSIEGYGTCRSAPRRLRAFGHTLHAANDLYEWGLDWWACGALFVAYRKSDGETPPPDFITGDNRQALNDDILDVMDLIGCFDE